MLDTLRFASGATTRELSVSKGGEWDVQAAVMHESSNVMSFHSSHRAAA